MPASDPESIKRPNIVIVLTDDLCYGDLACHGNPHVRTPELDRLHGESARLTHYCSGPLCTPARASLFTGRYPQRTRAIDTYCGRSMLDPGEVTLAEMLGDANYRTGLFGKWHLGDSYPVRPCDMGFDESLVHLGGGLRQPANIGYDGYFDPDLMHNGDLERRQGYCTDIFAEAAMKWIGGGSEDPFSCVVSANAPHSPFEIGEEWWDRYRDENLPEKWARVYGMVENIDWNVGRLRTHLAERGLAENTVFVFVSDHGPCGSAAVDGKNRFNCGLRARKGSVYQGGLKVPCFWHWPAGIAGGRDVDRLANPIDFLPTLAELCGASPPDDRPIDGRSLAPLLRGDAGALESWPDRSIPIQWHRGDEPIRYRNYAVVGQGEKLCRPGDSADDEYYDLNADPGETDDLAPERAERVADLRRVYDDWFDDVGSTRPDNYAPPRIVVGTARENPVVLNRNDWRIKDEEGQWKQAEHDGYWLVRIAESGSYQVTVYLPPVDRSAEVRLRVGARVWTRELEPGAEQAVFADLKLPEDDCRVEAQSLTDGSSFGAAMIRMASQQHPQTVDAEVALKNFFGAARQD